MKYSVFGTIFSIIALCLFTTLSYQWISWWCIIVGPFITLAACKPATEDGPWLWRRRRTHE